MDCQTQKTKLDGNKKVLLSCEIAEDDTFHNAVKRSLNPEHSHYIIMQ